MRKLFGLLAAILLFSGHLFAQSRTVTGKVTDETNAPVAGVSVTPVPGSGGTTTDESGNFSITVPPGTRSLSFSSVNFATQSVRIGTGSTVNVTLVAASSTNLTEIVVTANAIKREKRSLGVSAPTVSAEDLTRGQNASALNALAGKVSGVNITTTAGAPGSSSRIVIRGGSSIGGNNQALMVVDGIPIDNSSIMGGGALTSVDFGNRGNDINPDDIESVTVLKGPGAAALYGSRASNGALIITTKSGKKNANKKNEVTFKTGVTFSNVLKLPEFQNLYGQGYDNVTNDLIENWSWGPAFTGVTTGWGQTINGVQLQRPYSAVENNVKDFFETGKAYNNTLSFSGAGEKSTYYLSLNALNSNGVMPSSRDRYNKYSLRFNGTTQLTNKISSTLSVNYNKVGADEVGGGQGGGSVYNAVLQTPRNIPLTELKDLRNPYNSIGGFFDANGNETFGYYGGYTVNPYYLIQNYHNKNDVDRVTGNFSLTYKPNDWLDVTERLGTDVYSDRRQETDPKYSLVPVDNTWGPAAKNSPGRYYEASYNISEITHDLMITGRKEFSKDFTASLLVGNNIRMRGTNQLTAQTNAAGGLVIPGYYNLANSNGPLVNTNYNSKRRLVGLYADLNLSYKNFLFLGATARNDWSSTLPEQYNSFFYPSVNGSFVFTELLKNGSTSKWLNYGKLRASWAQVGNDADPYLLTSYFGATTINGGFGTTVFPLGTVPGYTMGNQIGNPNLRPEITSAFEVGTELGLFRNRVSIDFSYYENKSRDQILAAALPNSTGFTSRISNVGLVTNKGIELGVRATPIKTRYGLTWEVYGTYTRNSNLVSELDAQVVLGGFGGMSIVAANGKPYGNFYAQDNLKDAEGRTIINTATGLPILTTGAVYLGSYNPDYIASFGTNLTYKGWSLGILFDTKQGGKFFSRTKDIMAFVGTSAETAAGDRAGYIFPNSVYLDGGGKSVANTQYQFHPQDYFPSIVDGQNVLDASYIKLRELSLSYALPKTVLARTPFGSAAISLFGNNLWIKTASENKYADPEINSSGSGNAQGFDFTAQPSVRNYGVNLKVTF
ncbi:MAG: SusC/RagA family TonB-linked outer membrane protein [Bacteroidota bacterium]